MRNLLTTSILIMTVAATTPALAQDVPADYAGVLKTLNRQGDYKDNVLKVNIPRSDLKVVVPPRPWALDAQGNFDPAEDLLARTPA